MLLLLIIVLLFVLEFLF